MSSHFPPAKPFSCYKGGMSPYEDSAEADARNQLERFERPFLWLRRFFPIFTALSAMAAAVALTFIMSQDVRARKQADAEAKATLERTLQEAGLKIAQEHAIAQMRIEELEKTKADLVVQLEKLRRGGGKGQKYGELSPGDRELIDHVRSDEDQLQARLSKLEEALETTPEKALSTVIIKQRLDSLQDRTRGDIDSIRGEIGRLFTLTQWFIGLIFTIALGLLGLGLANLRKPRV